MIVDRSRRLVQLVAQGPAHERRERPEASATAAEAAWRRLSGFGHSTVE